MRVYLSDLKYFRAIVIVIILSLFQVAVRAQSSGIIQGQVTFEVNEEPVYRAQVMIVQLGSIVETNEEGNYVFAAVPLGVYDVIAYLTGLSSPSQTINVSSGQKQTLDFALSISPLKHELTVTAGLRKESAFETVQSVTSLDAFEIAENLSAAIGEVLDGQSGVSKRSFGAGNARPVIRGFDGDRVLVLQDGVRTGSLGATAADHSEPIDATNVERLEILKGPATLLYGSNAVGGVVNAVTGRQDYEHEPRQGLRGQISSVVGSNGGQAGTSANAEFGDGNWLFWGGGGGQRTGDYQSPLGTVANSKTRVNNARVGGGWFEDKGFARVGYDFSDGRFGVPGYSLNNPIENDFQWNKFQFSGGVKNLGSFVDTFRLSLTYVDWWHKELAILEDNTEDLTYIFSNEQFVYRGVFEQTPKGRLSGSFGFWGLDRKYDVFDSGSLGSLSPPTDQDSFAFFALEELNFDRVKVQFGARAEHTAYHPKGKPSRKFDGFSGGIGVRFRLIDTLAFVSNYTGSYRAPSLEELYNHGPHPGLSSYEIGNLNLKRERSHSFDFSLRQSDERTQSQANFFYYPVRDFIFLGPTGNIREGLVEAIHTQADVRFLGAEFSLNRELRDQIWLDIGLDWVDAKLTTSGVPLPRIPPLRARVGLDFRHKGLSLHPEVVLTDDQDRVYTTGGETRTSGHTVINLKASYTLPRRHFAHHFSMNAFNVGDRLYRNHVSFIKGLAPERGRGIRFSYVVKFF